MTQVQDRDQSSFGKDILGLALGALALFLGVSVVMSVVKGFSAEPGAMERIVQNYVGVLGSWPGLFLCAGLVVFGVALFLHGPRDSSLRMLLGVLCTSLGLALLCGAVANAGGWVGSHLHAVTRTAGPLVGWPIGFLACLAPIWWAWARPGALAVRKGAVARNPLDVLVREEFEGVSTAEASALGARSSRQRPHAEETTTAAPAPLPPLYPEDVRRKGQIPAGARPLESSHVAYRYDSAPLAPVSRASQEPAREDSARPHLAGYSSAQDEAGRTGEHAAAGAGSGSSLDHPFPGEESTVAPTVASIEQEVEELEARPAKAQRSASRPRAGWDQPDLYRAQGAAAPPDSTARPAARAAAAFEERELDEPGSDQEDLEGVRAAVLDAPEIAEEVAEFDDDDDFADDDDEEDEDDDEFEDDDEDDDFDEDEDEAEVDDDELEARSVEVVAASLASEPTHVLEPRSAPVAGRHVSGPDEIVVRAGELILERGRVAVSMLQREFGLDFKAATAVLDRLQAEGLIGPYLEGHNRAILMTAAEWQSRIAAT